MEKVLLILVLVPADAGAIYPCLASCEGDA